MSKASLKLSRPGRCRKRFGRRKSRWCGRDAGHKGQHRTRRTITELRRRYVR